MNKDLPLGLPQGSVRAVLAIGVTAAAVVASFMPSMPTEYLYPVALTVNAFYFASRPKAGDPDHAARS